MTHFDAWSIDLGSAASTRPLLAGDVYVAATATTLRGVDIYTGSDRWKPYALSSNGIGHFASAGNRLYFLGNAIDFGASAAAAAPPPTGQNLGGGLAGGGGNVGPASVKRLIVLDVATGKPCPEWAGVVPDDQDTMDPIIVSDVLILRSTKGRLSAFDAQLAAKPTLLWSLDAARLIGKSGIAPGPAGLGDDAAFFVIDGVLVAINVRSGQIRWRFPETSTQSAVDKSRVSLTDGDSLTAVSEPMVGNGLVLVVGQRTAYALNWRSGEILWSVDAPAGDRFNTPVVSFGGNTVFFTTRDGYAACHVLATGKSIYGDLTSGSPLHAQGFLDPVIDADVVNIDVESGHLLTEDRIFLTGRDGAVVIMAIEGDHANSTVPTAKQFKVMQEDKFQRGAGFKFAPVAGNGALFLTDMTGKVIAVSYSSTTAAYFGGVDTLALPAKKNYRFDESAFTLEMWIRTTSGGTALSQSADGADTGYRLAIITKPDGILSRRFGEGCVQFTLYNDKDGALLFAQTPPTKVNDGAWHHLAVRRHGNSLVIFIDGLSQPINTLIHRSLVPADELAQLSPATQRKHFPLNKLSNNIKVAPIGNDIRPIVIGGLIAAPNDPVDDAPNQFIGMVADVRIWNRLVSAKHLRNGMTKLLTGHEPGLIGYWPLNQKSPGAFKDETDDSLIGAANISGVKCIPSNLALDESLFPYLLHDVAASWPYKERWTVRAEDAPKWSPTGSGEVVCFATDQAVYAIDAIHGSRKWGRDTSRTSPLIADAQSCYLIEDRTAMALELERGHRLWSTDLPQAQPAAGLSALLFAPTLTVNCVVVTADGQSYFWLTRQGGVLLGAFVTSRPSATPPVAVGNRVYIYDGDTLCSFEEPAAVAGAGPQQLTPSAKVFAPVTGAGCLAADDTRLLLYDGAGLLAFDAATLSTPDKLAPKKAFAWNPPALPAVTGIGLAASLNSVIITTADGHVFFLEYGSGRKKGEAFYPATRVFAPVLQDQNVYCTMAATASGQGTNGIAVFEIKSGRLRAQDDTSSPPTGPAYVATDTAFFGVDNDGAPYPLDGRTYPRGARLDGEALHSIVFGSTCALLRKRGDAEVIIADVDRIFAGEAAEPVAGRNAFEDGAFTIEGWVNASSAKGGSIAVLPPGVSESGAPVAGFELSIDDAGCVIAMHLKAGSAVSFQSLPTNILDGRWRHLAAVFRRNEALDQQICYLYLDGLPLTGVKSATLSKIPNAVKDRSVTLGGVGAETFSGLLDEIRVWATWIPAAELLARRNVRLRGNEPDLLACWSFDATGVHDSSPNQLIAVDAAGHQALDIRLTDLCFSTPSYPYMIASTLGKGVVTQTLANGNGLTIDTAKYTTKISARTADGSPKAGAKIKIWASEASRIGLSGKIARVDIDTVTQAEFTLDTHGDLELELSNQNTAHSPVLWIWADYMYPNERFHVSPAVESNYHEVIAPPHLVAQSSLMQDIAYTPGDSLGVNHGSPGNFTIHDHADVTTIHTRLTAVSADGDAVPRAVIELWSDREVTIEVEAQRYQLSRENSKTFKTGVDGSLSITLHEDADPQGTLLDCPTLIARAGFMPRQSRFIVAPSENIGKVLSTVTGPQIVGDEALRPGEGKKILIGKLHQQDAADARAKAPAIAAVLNQMASLAKKPVTIGGEAAGTAAGAAAPQVNAANLPRHVFASDSVESLHGSVTSAQNRPITPEYMPNKHFVLSMLPNGAWSHKGFDTSDALDAHIATLSLNHDNAADLFKSIDIHSQNEVAGGFFSDMWDDIAHAWHEFSHEVSEVWDKAVHFIIKTWDEIKDDIGAIVHQVEVVLGRRSAGDWQMGHQNR